MLRLVKAAVFGLVIALAGMAVSFFPATHGLEEDFELALLFKLRGVRKAPADVVVISIDREASERLNVPQNPDRWPRSLHAELIEHLAREGAKAIVLDVYFIEPRSGEGDAALGEAIRKAGNVVLAEPLRLDEVPASGHVGSSGTHTIVKPLRTISPISRAAFATAPFVLPRFPFRINQYWTFQASAGDFPTFPVVTFQLYALSVYPHFLAFLEKVSPQNAGKLPPDIAAGFKVRGVARFMRDIREIFESEPSLADKMVAELERSKLVVSGGEEYKLIKSLIRMYSGANRRYLNFYGPPRTVTTLAYDRALHSGEISIGKKPPDLKGKAVFVGYSEILLAERQDSFHTVYSQSNGVFISGVEIAATAFANLLENSPVKTVSSYTYVFIILLWGVVVGSICRSLGTPPAGVAVVLLSLLYLAAAEYEFRVADIWSPMFIPLLVQMPLGFAGALLLNYFETNRERQNIRNALGYYVPNEVVNQLAKNIVDIRRGGQTVYGACLFADAAGYTNLSEKMGARELSDLMHEYFETTFEPIKQNGGFVVELKGDSILAIWKAQGPDITLGKQACVAALELAEAVGRFNHAFASVSLPTRIAVHAGEIYMGNIGAGDHYEYGVTGDTVNTAARLDGLNKYLETQILVSQEAIGDLDEFLTRKAGSFLLKGKTQPVVVYELLGRAGDIDEDHKKACAIFADALAAFKRRAWDEAERQFNQCVKMLGRDGLSQYYLKLCQEYRKHPPGGSWTGVISVDEK
jgi:adenylate cyclase